MTQPPSPRPPSAAPEFLDVDTALAHIRAGRMVIVVDDEDRENEGDLTMAADLVDAASVNFMATHGRGLICLALSEERVEALRLPMMTPDNRSKRGTAFTVSIDAREGITTGISASERAHTMRVAVDPRTGPNDLVAPGHVLPLRARRGGVLVRSGHTEAAIDLARLAGRAEAGVICEIMRDDGEMARLPDLEEFARKHGLGIVRIADLIQYRLRRELLVERLAETTATLRAAPGRPFRVFEYGTRVEDTRYLALVLGSPRPDRPTLVRVQTASLLRDVFGPEGPAGNGHPASVWLRAIEEAGEGVFLYVVPSAGAPLLPRDPAAPAREHASKAEGASAPDDDAREHSPLRDFGLGAQVLAHLGVGQVRLLTDNPRKLAGLEGFGIQIVECVPSREPAPVVALHDRSS